MLAPASAPAASTRVAALQVALRAHAVYDGAVDGLTGPGTSSGLRRFQARAGLVPDGIVGPRTRRALGSLGRHPVGSRPLRVGHRGWDVAALQFALETHGFPCGTVDGGFGARTNRRGPSACRPSPASRPTASPARPHSPPSRARRWRLPRSAARSTRPSATATAPAARASHAGLDFPAATGTPITAASAGRVAFAGYDDGWGLTVVLDHGNAVRTRYAHLSAATVSLGASVSAGTRVGRVGSTGHATGPAPALRSHRPRSQRLPTLLLKGTVPFNLKGTVPLGSVWP